MRSSDRCGHPCLAEPDHVTDEHATELSLQGAPAFKREGNGGDGEAVESFSLRACLKSLLCVGWSEAVRRWGMPMAVGAVREPPLRGKKQTKQLNLRLGCGLLVEQVQGGAELEPRDLRRAVGMVET